MSFPSAGPTFMACRKALKLGDHLPEPNKNKQSISIKNRCFAAYEAVDNNMPASNVS